MRRIPVKFYIFKETPECSKRKLCQESGFFLANFENENIVHDHFCRTGRKFLIKAARLARCLSSFYEKIVKLVFRVCNWEKKPGNTQYNMIFCLGLASCHAIMLRKTVVNLRKILKLSALVHSGLWLLPCLENEFNFLDNTHELPPQSIVTLSYSKTSCRECM